MKHPENTRVVYVGPERDDIKERLGTVVLDPKDSRNRSVVVFDDGASMSIHMDDLVTQVAYEERQANPAVPAPVESLTDEQAASFKVDPFAFRLWLIENTTLTEEQVTLMFLVNVFSEFDIFVKEI